MVRCNAIRLSSNVNWQLEARECKVCLVGIVGLRYRRLQGCFV